MAKLTHLKEDGSIRMVDISPKNSTPRRAVAKGAVKMSVATLELCISNQAPKGDVIAAARIGAIMGANRTSELIPLCHQLSLSHVDVVIAPDLQLPGLQITATASTVASTGVEMEALTAVSIAGLIIYDMLKSADKYMIIGDICLLEKHGGKSGSFVRNSPK